MSRHRCFGATLALLLASQPAIGQWNTWDQAVAPPKQTGPVPTIDCARFRFPSCWLGYITYAGSVIGVAVACGAPSERLAPFGERNFDVMRSLAADEKQRDASIEMLMAISQNAAKIQAGGGPGSMQCSRAPKALEEIERLIGLRK